MSKIKLLLASPITDECLSEIKKYCEVNQQISPENGGPRVFSQEMIEEYSNHEIIVLSLQDVTDECLHKWHKTGLKLLVCTRGTPVNVPWKTVKELGIMLVYAPGRNAQAVAEMTIGLILGLTRNIAWASHRIRSGELTGDPVEDIYSIPDRKDINWIFKDGKRIYDCFEMNYEMQRKNLGIVGFGAIEKKLLHIAKNGFDMNVLVYDPYVSEETITQSGGKCCDLDYLLKNSDFVSIHLPVNPETVGSVNMSWFEKMKPTAFLINTARASVINQKDIIQAIENNIIAGYAADVSWIEPIPENHPFVDRGNVLLTPHIGAQVQDIKRHQSEIITSDIIAYCQSRTPKNIWKRIE